MSLNTLPLLNPRETLKPDKNSTLRTSRNGAYVENADAVCIFAISFAVIGGQTKLQRLESTLRLSAVEQLS